MASSTFKPVPMKRLAEFLQERQEPYTLDMCISKRFLNNSRRDFGENLKGSSCICNPMKRIRPPKSSRMLKLITNKIISYRNRKCSIHSTAQTQESAINRQLIKGTDCVSYSDEENFHFSPLQVQNSEAITTKCQCKQIILRLQQSPVVASPFYKNSQPLVSYKQESPYLSTPDSWDIRSGFSKYVKDGGAVLIQTNKLLLDYANIQGKQGSEKSTREMLVPDDGLRQIIYRQICLWRKQPGDHKNITQLIDSDISTLEEWSDFQQLNRDTEIEIGDSILDDIVTELINLN